MNNPDYIERSKILQVLFDACEECIDACDDGYGVYTDCSQCMLGKVKMRIRTAPAADVRAVVTCADCKHWHMESGGDYCCTREAEEDENIPGLYYGFVEYHEPDFFCAYGKRRDADV